MSPLYAHAPDAATWVIRFTVIPRPFYGNPLIPSAFFSLAAIFSKPAAISPWFPNAYS
jgi:hypothetical protein